MRLAGVSVGGGAGSAAAASEAAARRGHRKNSADDAAARKKRSRSRSKGGDQDEESDDDGGGDGEKKFSSGGDGNEEDEDGEEGEEEGEQEEEEVERGNSKVGHDSVPCSCPDGACDKSCACFANGNYCERGCGCPISCPFRFPGCDCRSGCSSGSCFCLAASHECDPDLCRNCRLAPAVAAFGSVGVGSGGGGVGSGSSARRRGAAAGVAEVLAARAPAPVKAAVAAAALRGFGGGTGDRVTARGAGLKRLPGAPSGGADYTASGSARVSSWGGWQQQQGAFELGDGGASVDSDGGGGGEKGQKKEAPAPAPPRPPPPPKPPAPAANARPCHNMRLRLRQHRRLAMGRSAVAGWGCFVLEKTRKGDLLGEYVGELVSNREADRRGKAYDRDNNSYLFDLSKETVIDARGKGCKLRFANHSPDANCSAKILVVDGDSRVAIFAARDLEPGEELFYDYMYDEHNAPPWARD